MTVDNSDGGGDADEAEGVSGENPWRRGVPAPWHPGTHSMQVLSSHSEDRKIES